MLLTVRAKIYKIDSGKEEWLDYERIIEILRTVNYNGNMSIVFEGQGNQVSDLEAIGLAVTYLPPPKPRFYQKNSVVQVGKEVNVFVIIPPLPYFLFYLVLILRSIVFSRDSINYQVS